MPKQIVARLLGASLLTLAAAGSALAHATLETGEAPANSSYKAVVRIGHGCEGKPTQAVRVRIPEGVDRRQADAKGRLATRDDQGRLRQELRLLRHAGGRGRDRDRLDRRRPARRLVRRVRLPGPADRTSRTAAVVYFPVVQECADGAVHRWIEIPEPGKSADDYEDPAPA